MTFKFQVYLNKVIYWVTDTPICLSCVRLLPQFNGGIEQLTEAHKPKHLASESLQKKCVKPTLQPADTMRGVTL